MTWIRRISSLSQAEKEGFYRILIPPSLFQRLLIDPISFRDENGNRVMRFFCPPGDNSCLIEIRIPDMDDPLYSIQMSDSSDSTQINWDFVIINDPDSEYFKTLVDKDGRDTLFGWASRMLDEEENAMNHGLLPGQARKGLGLTREVIKSIENFCRIFDIKSIKLEALFYHNAITYERCGFSYFSGYKEMKRIHELFLTDGTLYKLLDRSTPFRQSGFARTVSGRSWAIHDGILDDLEDTILEDGWVSPVMYKMVGKERPMITFPDPVY